MPKIKSKDTKKAKEEFLAKSPSEKMDILMETPEITMETLLTQITELKENLDIMKKDTTKKS